MTNSAFVFGVPTFPDPDDLVSGPNADSGTVQVHIHPLDPRLCLCIIQLKILQSEGLVSQTSRDL